MRIERGTTPTTTLRVRGDLQLTIHFTDARSADDVRRGVTATARRMGDAATVTADVAAKFGFHDRPILPRSGSTVHLCVLRYLFAPRLGFEPNSLPGRLRVSDLHWSIQA